MVYFSPKKNNYGILVLDKRSIIMVLEFSQKKKKKKKKKQQQQQHRLY